MDERSRRGKEQKKRINESVPWTAHFWPKTIAVYVIKCYKALRYTEPFGG